MPRQPMPYHSYSVYLISFATPEIAELVKRGELHITQPTQLRSESFYFGDNERQAGVKFYQAAKAGMSSPLAFSVVVRRDSRMLVQMSFDR